VYFISHNIARLETGEEFAAGIGMGASQKAQRGISGGASSARAYAFRADRPSDFGFPASTGGSSVMVARPGAAKSAYSGQPRRRSAEGRKAAIREFDQKKIDESFTAHDILTKLPAVPEG